MSEMIQKPDANPIVAALLTAFVLGLGHFLINGQQRKWVYTLVATFVGLFLCLIPGWVLGIMSIIEAYKTAQRLADGESVGENEYSFAPLYNIIQKVDGEATLGGEQPAE